MTARDAKPPINTQILEQAAEWLVELNAEPADASARQRFDAWLRTSPEHVRMYLELLPAWEDGASLPSAAELSVGQLIAMGQQDSGAVISLQGRFEPAVSRAATARTEIAVHRGRRRARGLTRIGIALSASLVMAIGGFWLLEQRNLYVTEIGEQRSFTLEDGSSISLHADTRVRIDFTRTRRNLELLQGQALFQAAKNPLRPFTVIVDKTEVLAVGTRFDVNRRKHATVVTVVEGAVAVIAKRPTREGSNKTHDDLSMHETPAENGRNSTIRARVLVNAGEQVTVAGSIKIAPIPAHLDDVTAWTQRRLVFDASTLSEVVEEFNRYNARKLVLADMSLETLPITAAFSSPDPMPLIRFLRAQPGLHLIERDREFIISREE